MQAGSERSRTHHESIGTSPNRYRRENSEVVERYTTLFRQAIGAACERAVEQGEISRDISQTLAASLLSSLLGASVTAKSGATAAALDAIYDGLAHTLNLHRATKPDRR